MERVTHVFFVPGMAADVSIFEHIKLPEDRFAIHLIPWKIPKKDESLPDYAKRMTVVIKNEPCVLLGVSFGGIVVQEMSKFIKASKVIIVSSVKCNAEFPNRIRVVGKTKAYRFFPTSLISKIENWEKLAFGDFAKKRAALYQKYLSVKDKTYLDWSIEKIVHWDKTEPDPDIIHIHGDKDVVFPIIHIKNCIIIKGGTHAMIINRARWFNDNLPKIIDENYG
ncbi:alpha/beta hydrolase [Aquimarina sp. ERC-38]|uniref:alpha/beta hydrolase n=1 Tax=Aquimarina sp. ERC-38 TaxID=2949996 RepID=UPI00224706AC|nr:alpha/beta hydrolase [Aquimarina sp. ERC-38]UZO80741.1 alpha/beta hydrolase [Aquimarina sp. ERC-38]